MTATCASSFRILSASFSQSFMFCSTSHTSSNTFVLLFHKSVHCKILKQYGVDFIQILFAVGVNNVDGIDASKDLLHSLHSEFRMDITCSVCNEQSFKVLKMSILLKWVTKLSTKYEIN